MSSSEQFIFISKLSLTDTENEVVFWTSWTNSCIGLDSIVCFVISFEM